MRSVDRPSGLTAGRAIVAFDEGWGEFVRATPDGATLAALDDADLCALYGIPVETLSLAVSEGIRAWRDSPSASVIHVLDGIGNGQPTGPMFPGILAQTRVIFSAVKAGLLSMGSLLSVKDARGRIAFVSNDAQAVTLDERGIVALNDVARALRAWELRNRARVETGLVRLPRLLHRGIRSRDVGVEFERRSGVPYEILHSRRIDAQVRRLRTVPLAEVSGSPILSFTANEGVAQRFAVDEGFVVSADTSRLTIVGSWATDPALAGKDSVLGIHEREWIVRLDPDLVLAAEGIAIRDRTYAKTTVDPAGITMLHHYDHATYELEGRKVEARFRYNSNGVGGRVVFRVDGDWWARGRRTIARETGFDPVPGPGREATNLVYFHQEPFVGSVHHYARHVPEVEADEPDDGASEAPEPFRAGR